MKKILWTLSLIASMLGADMLGNIGLGYSRGENDGNYVTGFGTLNAIAGIGLRLEYTKNIDEHKAFSKEDVSRYGFFFTYALPILPSLTVTPKAGFVKTDGDFTLKEVATKVTDSKTRFTYGLEVDYFLNSQFSLFLGYTDYGKKLELNHINSSDLDRSNYLLGLKLHL